MRRLKAEWESHNLIMISFPHAGTDWSDGGLESAYIPFVQIAQAIAYTQTVYVLCDKKENIVNRFCTTVNIIFIEVPTNDTWVRDYGVISIEEDGNNGLVDFTFNGWGDKFKANLDNDVNKILSQMGYFANTTLESLDYILEGGSIDSDGSGTILATSKCLCNLNRNVDMNKKDIEEILYNTLGSERVLWLDFGYLSGDDTDSHIDTLARFINKETIAFVNCKDKDDKHFLELHKMKSQLETFRQKDGSKYKLIELPMTRPIVDKNGNRLPATYANFLITNKALLYPTYEDSSDKEVGEIFKMLFPGREIIPINCLKLIEQGGSLHCSTMQVSF